MVEEKIYKLENGTEYILMDRITYKDKRYLLLLNNADETSEIGYEENNQLFFIKEDDPNYDELIIEFAKKMNIE